VRGRPASKREVDQGPQTFVALGIAEIGETGEHPLNAEPFVIDGAASARALEPPPHLEERADPRGAGYFFLKSAKATRITGLTQNFDLGFPPQRSVGRFEQPLEGGSVSHASPNAPSNMTLRENTRWGG